MNGLWLTRATAEVAITCRRLGLRLTPQLVVVSVREQRLVWLRTPVGRRSCGADALRPPAVSAPPEHRPTGLRCSTRVFRPADAHRAFVISTSRYGVGQTAGSNRTPLGLHRIAQKVGAGWPVGTVFKSRRPIGFTWQGLPEAGIVHRILWLEGLEPGRNQGGDVDTFRRYVYIHGFSDETTLGRPASCGCIHVGAGDLMPFFDQVPIGTLVWVSER